MQNYVDSSLVGIGRRGGDCERREERGNHGKKGEAHHDHIQVSVSNRERRNTEKGTRRSMEWWSRNERAKTILEQLLCLFPSLQTDEAHTTQTPAIQLINITRTLQERLTDRKIGRLKRYVERSGKSSNKTYGNSLAGTRDQYKACGNWENPKKREHSIHTPLFPFILPY